jgi:hypothetical protein
MHKLLCTKFFFEALNLTLLANPFWTSHYLLNSYALCLLSFFTTNTHNLTLFSSLPTNTHNFIFYYSLTLNTQEVYKTQWVLESSFKMHTLNKFCNQHKLRAKFRWPQVLMQKVMWYPIKLFCAQFCILTFVLMKLRFLMPCFIDFVDNSNACWNSKRTRLAI